MIGLESKLKTFQSESDVDTDEPRLVIDTSSPKVSFKVKFIKNPILDNVLKLPKQKEPETQTQIENPETLESNAEKPNESAANENEESSLEDEINRVLEAAKDLPDLPPDVRPSPQKSKNTDKPESSDETVDSDPVIHISATPESDSQDVPGLESVPKENPNLEITTKDKSTGTNFTGIHIKKKEMAMFWDGQMVESENIPEIVFTKESYRRKLFGAQRTQPALTQMKKSVEKSTKNHLMITRKD